MLDNIKVFVVVIISFCGFIVIAQSVSNKGSIELSDVLIDDEYLSFNVV